jgi:hypothetical protein
MLLRSGCLLAVTLGVGLLASCSAQKPTAASRVQPTPAASAPRRDEDQIREVFERYRQAARDKDGERVVACLDQKTLAWYATLRQDALKLTRSQLASQDLHRQLFLLLLRHEFDRATLEQLTGAGLLARGIRLGWLDADRGAAEPPSQPGVRSGASTELGAIFASRQSAYALVPGGDATPRYFFQKEADGWKVNLTSYHQAARALLAQHLEESKQKPEDLLRTRLKELSGRAADERIFEGPLEATTRKDQSDQ